MKHDDLLLKPQNSWPSLQDWAAPLEDVGGVKVSSGFAVMSSPLCRLGLSGAGRGNSSNAGKHGLFCHDQDQNMTPTVLFCFSRIKTGLIYWITNILFTDIYSTFAAFIICLWFGLVHKKTNEREKQNYSALKYHILFLMMFFFGGRGRKMFL